MTRDEREDEDEDEHEHVDEPAARGGEPRRISPWIPIAVLAVLVVAVAGYAFTQQNRASDLDGRIERTDDVADAASRFAVALLSYDYQDLTASTTAIVELSTETFAEQYRQAFARGLGAEITELEATSDATIIEVLVARSSGDTARAVVIADSTITSLTGSKASVGTYLDLTLLRVDGEWKVDSVTSIANTGQASEDVPTVDPSDPEEPTTTSTTTTTSEPPG